MRFLRFEGVAGVLVADTLICMMNFRSALMRTRYIWHCFSNSRELLRSVFFLSRNTLLFLLFTLGAGEIRAVLRKVSTRAWEVTVFVFLQAVFGEVFPVRLCAPTALKCGDGGVWGEPAAACEMTNSRTLAYFCI